MIYLTATDFSFITDQDARDYLADITEVMMRCFGITREEALGRINDSWSHVPEVVGEDD